MRIVFSRDRACQLDLLLRSLQRLSPPERTVVIWKASTDAYRHGYMIARNEGDTGVEWWLEDGAGDFETLVRIALDTTDRFTTFLCDDDVLFRRWNSFHEVDWPAEWLCWSHRLGENTVRSYTTGAVQSPPVYNWSWGDWSRSGSDFDYPGSIDGHTFRTIDLRRMLEGKIFPNPTALECALVAGCGEIRAERPQMVSAHRSILVSLPWNRVSEQSNVPHGDRPEYSAVALNERFLAGGRIDLDAIDFSAVDAAHCLLELPFTAAVTV